MAYQGLGLAAAATGYGEEARHHYAQAVGLLDAGRVAVGLYQVAGVGLASVLVDLDEVDEAVKVAEASRRRIERRGALALVPFAHMITAGAHIYAGRWADALAEIDVAMEISDEIGNHTWVVVGEALKGWVALHRGDLAAAQAHIAAGTQRLAEVGLFFGADWLFDIQVELLAATGQRDAALQVAEVVWAQTAHIRHILGGRPRGVMLVRLAMGAGRHTLAAEVTAELEEGARRTPAASAIGAALQCRGLVEQDPDLLLQAVARYRQTPRRPETARCCEDAAAVLATAGRPDEAIALLHEAATIHGELDAAGDTARVDAALKATRGAPIPPPDTTTDVRVGLVDTDGDRRHPTHRRGTDQSRDRRPPVHLPPDRRNPPLARLPQARPDQSNPTRRRALPAHTNPLAPSSPLGATGTAATRPRVDRPVEQAAARDRDAEISVRSADLRARPATTPKLRELPDAPPRRTADHERDTTSATTPAGPDEATAERSADTKSPGPPARTDVNAHTEGASMHHPTPTDEAAQTRSPGQRSPHTSADAPQPGDRFLGPSGRIWTVQTITTRGNRIVLTTPTPDGDSAAIVDHLAVARMIPLPITTSSPDDTPAITGVKPMHRWQRDATGDDERPRPSPRRRWHAHDDDTAYQAVAP